MVSPFEIRLVMHNPNLMLDLRIFQADYLGEKLFATEPFFRFCKENQMMLKCPIPVYRMMIVGMVIFLMACSNTDLDRPNGEQGEETVEATSPAAETAVPTTTADEVEPAPVATDTAVLQDLPIDSIF